MTVDVAALVDNAFRVGTFRFVRSSGMALRNPAWTAEERQLLRQHANEYTLPQLADLLNRRAHDGRAVRNENSVKVKLVRYQINRNVKLDDELTAREIGNDYLGKCGKSVAKLIDMGVLPGRELPYDGRTVRVVRRVTLYRWATRPENWIYFKVGRMTDQHLKRLVIRAQSLWPDKWLRVGQVVKRVCARGIEIDYRDVNRAIVRHGLQAARWDNWYVRRSAADAFDWASIKGGSGAGHELPWSPGGDAFITLALAVGMPYATIAAGMGWAGDHRRVPYRLSVLTASGELLQIAQRLGVQVSADGRVFADWRDHADRFPGLARAAARFLAGRETAVDRHHLSRVLAVWAGWHAQTAVQVEVARRLPHVTRPTRPTLWAYYDELLSWGIDPFGGYCD